MITNPKRKIYVGSTINIDQRFKAYKRLNCKTQTKLYNSFKKYGVENHIFEVIFKCNITDLLKYENLIGNGFNVLEKDIGLNLSLPKLGEIYSCVSKETGLKISKANLGKKHTKEFKNKIGLIHKGKIISKESKDKMSKAKLGKNTKIVYQYDLENNFIRKWNSAIDIQNELGIFKSNIAMCCSGKYKQAKGFIWSYDFKKFA